MLSSPLNPFLLYAHYYRHFGRYRALYASLLAQWRAFFATLHETGFAAPFDPHWYLSATAGETVVSLDAQLDLAEYRVGFHYPTEVRFALSLFTSQQLHKIRGLFGCADVYDWRVQFTMLDSVTVLSALQNIDISESADSPHTELGPLLWVGREFSGAYVRARTGELVIPAAYPSITPQPLAPDLMCMVRARTASLREGVISISPQLCKYSAPSLRCYLNLFRDKGCPTAITRGRCCCAGEGVLKKRRVYASCMLARV
jgi:hypothetical protein